MKPWLPLLTSVVVGLATACAVDLDAGRIGAPQIGQGAPDGGRPDLRDDARPAPPETMAPGNDPVVPGVPVVGESDLGGPGCGPLSASLYRHLTISGDGAVIAAVRGSGTVDLFDADIGEVIGTIHRPRSNYDFSLRLLDRGRLLVTSEESGKLVLWSTTGGSQIGALEGDFGTYELSPRGDLMLSSRQPGKVLRLPGSEIAWSDGRLTAARFSADGGLIASVQRRHAEEPHDIFVFDATTGALRATWHMKSVWKSGPVDVAVSDDGRWAAAASGDDGLVVVRLSDGREWKLRTHEGAIEFSPGGRHFILRDSHLPTQVWSLGADGPTPAMSVDEPRVVFTGDDLIVLDSTATLRRLSIKDRQQRWTMTPPIGHSDMVTGVAVSEDGRRAASVGYERRLIVWDLARRSAVRVSETDARPWAVALSPDGRQIAVGDEGNRPRPPHVTVWDVDKGTELARLPVVADGLELEVRKVTFTTNGRYLVVTLRRFHSPHVDGRPSRYETLVYSTEGWRPVWRVSGALGPAAVAPDGSRITIALTDKLRVLRTHDGALMREVPLACPDGPPSACDGVSLGHSPDGRHLVASWMHAAVVMDGDRLEPRHAVAPPRDYFVGPFAVSNDSELLAAYPTAPGAAAILLDLQRGTVIMPGPGLPLATHRGVGELAFVPGKRMTFTAEGDGRLWLRCF